MKSPALDVGERLLAERECERLIMVYSHLIDGGEAERVAELFADDGVWESESRRADGRAEIRGLFRRRQSKVQRTSRHVCTNIVVDVVSATEAVGLTYYTLYRYEGGEGSTKAPLNGPVMIGDYRDRFVLTSEGWRFSHRRASAAFVQPREETGRKRTPPEETL
jgi:ketosteroid isomerase-like protein